MRKTILFFVLLSFFYVTSGQTVLQRAQYLAVLDDARDTVNSQVRDASRLVSEYAFRKLVRNDYAVLLTGEKNKTTVGRYASLELDEDEQTVSITPIAFVPGNDPLRARFRWIHSLNLTASTNSQKFFDVKDRTKVSAGYSVTLIDGAYKFDDNGSCPKEGKRGFWIFESPCKPKPPVDRYVQLHDAVYNDFARAYSTMANLKDSLDVAEYGSDETDLKKAYLDKVTEYEYKLTKDVWNVKRLAWLKLDLTPLSWDNLNIVDLEDTASFRKPGDKAVYNPSVQVSGNVYWMFRRYGGLYLNGWVKGGIKHTLSEIGSTSAWQAINPLGDSAFYEAESKSVYVLSSSQIKTKVLPDFGVQLVYMLPYLKQLGKISVGVDASASWKGFLSPSAQDGTGFVRVGTLGLVIPLKDKEGENTLLLEPFFERKKYQDYNKATEKTWGVRFSLPFKTILK